MKEKVFTAVCVLGILFLVSIWCIVSPGQNAKTQVWLPQRQTSEEAASARISSVLLAGNWLPQQQTPEETTAVAQAFAEQLLYTQALIKQIPLTQAFAEEFAQQPSAASPEEAMRLETVNFPVPTATLNGKEGEMYYLAGLDCVLIDADTVLLPCDCYFAEEKLQQKIFYVAKAPDFVPREVFRQTSCENTDTLTYRPPERLEHRIVCPIPVADGYVYELDGDLYHLSADFSKADFLCDLRGLMGGLYDFSPWVGDQENNCDVTADSTRLLACTDAGLYEYDLARGTKKLLEPADYEPYEIVHIEGDCDCGETGFTFSGPIYAEYAPDDQGYVFVTGDEYGDAMQLTFRSADGRTLYSRDIPNTSRCFSWLETENTSCLAVFYSAVFYGEDGALMDLIAIDTGETDTFAVPDAVFCGQVHVCFLDADSLVYCKECVARSYELKGQKRSTYDVCRFRGENAQEQGAAPEPAFEEDMLFDLGNWIITWREAGT